MNKKEIVEIEVISKAKGYLFDEDCEIDSFITARDICEIILPSVNCRRFNCIMISKPYTDEPRVISRNELDWKIEKFDISTGDIISIVVG